LSFDEVLGLGLQSELGKSSYVDSSCVNIDGQSLDILLQKRQLARSEKNWSESDRIRDLVTAAGYLLEDGVVDQKVRVK